MNVFSLKKLIEKFFLEKGITSPWIDYFTSLILLFTIFLLGIFLFWSSRLFILGLFNKVSQKTKTTFDDLLIQKRVPHILSYFPVIFLFYELIPPILLPFSEALTSLSTKVLDALTIVVVIAVIRAFLKSFGLYIKTFPALKDKPIDSYIQVIMIFLWFVGGILILSVLTGREIGAFLTALGALSAVLMFVFKDTILGFVASVQITVNDTVRIGDWISMPNNHADGDVISISLSTVQVQNFDKTITSVPTHKLMTDPFINWRGMSESPGRRIKRSILIKISSIRFLTQEEINTLQKIERLAPFIKQRNAEIEASNTEKKVNKELLINGRNFTNLGLFRHYTEAYLMEHPMVNTDMTVMCRQLAPTSQGIPIEVYVFSKDKEWKNYEHISADIFDHLLSATPYFKLECFELSPVVSQ